MSHFLDAIANLAISPDRMIVAVAQSASKEDAYSNGFHDAVRAAMGLAEKAQCDIEHLTEENERLLDALKDRQARCSKLADQLAERQQMCRDLAATLDKAHGLVTQWLARPEPPNTGELIALATLLEGKQQPEAGREVK